MKSHNKECSWNIAPNHQQSKTTKKKNKKQNRILYAYRISYFVAVIALLLCGQLWWWWWWFHYREHNNNWILFQSWLSTLDIVELLFGYLFLFFRCIVLIASAIDVFFDIFVLSFNSLLFAFSFCFSSSLAMALLLWKTTDIHFVFCRVFKINIKLKIVGKLLLLLNNKNADNS